MKIAPIFALISGLFSFGLSAATVEAGEESLKQVLGSLASLSAEFSQVVYDAEEPIYEATGKLYLSRPGKVRWETEFPDETLMIADGESIWNIDSFVEQVTVIDQQSAVENNPIILLTSLDDQVWSQFDIKKVDQLADIGVTNATHGFVIRSLVPDAQINALTLYFNQQIIVGMSTVDAQGQLSQLTFQQVDHDSSIDPTLFSVSIPDSYTLDDQR